MNLLKPDRFKEIPSDRMMSIRRSPGQAVLASGSPDRLKQIKLRQVLAQDDPHKQLSIIERRIINID